MARTELEAGAHVDRFEIVRLLGSGGMGAVYEAKDPELGRSVALKVIREPDPHLSLRLLREAQALAQLQHPNVVAVHEVGTDGDEVFIAMELVDGASFDKLSPKPASWREVVELFVQAGRGLAAAHAKELVHRDVKPSNLFVGRDGRVRVGDFGLARKTGDDDASWDRAGGVAAALVGANDTTLDSPSPGTPEPARSGGGLLGATLTHQGSLIGTPRYMAPEQSIGRRANAQSDQYSFCLALEEMLPPRVPGWLSRAVERGLDPDPAARHPSMQALVDLLAHTPRRMQRRAMLGAAVLGAAAIAGAFLFVATREAGGSKVPAACASGPARMVGIWDPDRRAAVEAAFAATEMPYAAATFARVAAVLDARRDEWVTMHREACEATHVHRTQSPEMLDRRMACLDERRANLGGFVTALTAIKPKQVDNADDEVGDVGRVADCADRKQLERTEMLPTDPAERQRYEELIAELSRVRATLLLGDYKAVMADAAKLADEAKAHGWLRISAQARFLEGNAHTFPGHVAEARVALEACARDAADAGDDFTAMKAWVVLVPTLSEAGEVEAAKALLTAADTAVRRAGNPPSYRSKLMQAEGWIAALGGDMKRGREVMEETLALLLRELPERLDYLTQVLGNLAAMETQLGEHPQAIAHRRRALAASVVRYGKLHPYSAEALAELGQALQAGGERAAGRDALVEALGTLEALYGPDSPTVANALQSLANAQEDTEQAVAESYLERAAAIHEKAGTAGLGRALIALAQTRLELKDKVGAREAVEKAFPLIEKRLGTENMEYAAAESTYGMAVGCSAKARLVHAVDVLTKELGPEHGLTVDAVATLAKCK